MGPDRLSRRSPTTYLSNVNSVQSKWDSSLCLKIQWYWNRLSVTIGWSFKARLKIRIRKERNNVIARTFTKSICRNLLFFFLHDLPVREPALSILTPLDQVVLKFLNWLIFLQLLAELLRPLEFGVSHKRSDRRQVLLQGLIQSRNGQLGQGLVEAERSIPWSWFKQEMLFLFRGWFHFFLMLGICLVFSSSLFDGGLSDMKDFEQRLFIIINGLNLSNKKFRKKKMWFDWILVLLQ